jgi:hypothetical protein
MADRVYIETTIVSYLTAWRSRDIVVAGHQQVTIEWWRTCRPRYHLCISPLVLTESSAGDAQAAQERLAALDGLEVLEATRPAFDLASSLLRAGALPQKAADDAAHVAIAAVNAVPFLLTWNCRHLANAAMRPIIESVCREHGFTAPIICTPEELMGS